MATTVTGTIKTADGATFTGTITFSPHPRIKIIGVVSVLGSVVTESVSGGALNIELEAGNYYVEAPGTKPFRITVPASGTVDISTIIVSGAGNVAVAEVGIPSGGTTGQVLTKGSGDDYDTDWEDSAGGGVEEAPIDGTAYARQDGDWVVLAGGGDMLASTYDTNSDGKVNSADAADSVPDTGVAFTDNTTGNASTSAHGFAPKMAAPAAGLLNVLGTANGDIAPEAKGLFDATAPAELGTASSGTSVLAARRDHVHQMPKLDDVAAPDDNEDLNASTSTHGLAPKASAPASGFLNVLGIANGETAYTNKGLYNDSATPAADGVAATGTSVYASRRDHVHPAAEGTAIKSTGETGGTKFLREDGDGTSSWQTAPSDATSIRGVAIDSTVGSPSDGSILVYRTAGSDWVLEAKPAAGSNPAIADITDWPAGVTATEVGYLDNATSEIQSQLNAKAPLVSPSFTTPSLGAATATSLAFGADPADSGAVRLSNNTAIAWETVSGTDAYIAVDSSDVLNFGQNVTSVSFNNAPVTGVLSLNKVTITAPATAATLTLATGSTLATSGAYSITLTSTAATNVTLPTTGTLATTTQLSDYVAKATYDAHSILYATTDNTPATLTVSEASVVGRLTGGNIAALTGANVRTIAGLATSDSPQFTGIELGHASDTTIARVGAGQISVEGVNVVTTSSTDTLTNKTVGAGTLTLAEGAGIGLDPAGSADEKWTGITVTGTAGATLAVGDLVYLDATAGEWLLADADAASTSGDVPLALCILAANDGQATNLLLFGTMRSAAFPASIALGAPVYVSTDAGDITATKPSGTDDVVRRVGWAITTEPNTIFFNPSNDYATDTGA